MFYDRDGNLCSANEFGKSETRVARTRLGGVDVSTVFLGVSTDNPPRLFETMIFGGDYDQEQWRYCTELDALAGHLQIVERLQRGDRP